MIKYYCDSCLQEQTNRSINTFEVPVHLIDPLNLGYVDQNLVPFSGRRDTFHLCNSCINIAYTAALEATKLLIDSDTSKPIIINWNTYIDDFKLDAGRYLVRLKYNKMTDLDYDNEKVVLLNLDDEGLWKDDVGISINKNQINEFISVDDLNADKFQGDLNEN